MENLLSAGGKNVFYGVILIAASIFFLLSGLGLFLDQTYIFNSQLDLLVSIGCLICGLALVYSEVGRPGKPKFEIQMELPK